MNKRMADSSSWKRNFWLIHAGIPALLALLILVVFEITDLDVQISNLFYDPVTGEFPLKRNWFLEVVMHDWTKYVTVMIACMSLAGFVCSYWMDVLRRHRRVLLFVFLIIGMGAGSVALLKSVTNKHCPWDLEMYGGYAPYVKLLEHRPSGIKEGECFPAGHATTGFGLMGLYFIWYRRKPRYAQIALWGGLLYGFILGGGRILQGAHFLSHHLWSAIICWYIALVLYRVLLYEADKVHAESVVDDLAPSVKYP